jgi:hypothetical protein
VNEPLKNNLKIVAVMFGKPNIRTYLCISYLKGGVSSSNVWKTEHHSIISP